MKKLFTLLILIRITTSSIGQTNLYHPFPDSNASWCEETDFNYCFSSPPDVVSRYNYWITADTMINGTTYHILSLYNMHCDNCTGICGYTSGAYYYRQDVALKKVWRYDFAAGTDTILYDFDLHVGDTLDRSRIFWGGSIPSMNFIVRYVDSVLIGGQYRKSFNYSPDIDTNCLSTIIEGIGDAGGLMNGPNVCIQYAPVLHKFYQNNLLLFGDSMPDYMACPSPGAGVADLGGKQHITITPNPVGQNGNIKIAGMTYAEWALQIFDLTGRRMKELRFTGSSTELGTIGLNAGVYLLRFTDKKSNMRFATMVIQ